MIAEWQIRDLTARFARGVDRRDGALIRDCFHQGPLTHDGVFDGNVDQFVPWVWQRWLSSHHALPGAIRNRLAGQPVRHSRSCGHLCDRTAQERWRRPASQLGQGIRYVDRFERRSDYAASSQHRRRKIVVGIVTPL